ncbi:ATP-binding protein [Actinomadura opuntiae]|uniref:ATP-binding protein n=1 Tax=Actinomadura sp. OS1-43 TaxID=604315 RepID=UPI00255AEB86|nr:ATP-binding protein [Actinomadura sp. OS1-43]MDL4819096.1 ATP-binding protein [Actinomadura sp. OS1-43]
MTTAAQETRKILMDHEFLSTPAAVSITRRAAVRALVVWGLSEAQAEDFELVVSELVTNAVTQARHKRIKVRICEEVINTLTIEVWDSVPAPPHREAPSLDAEDGRGLLIVEQLAAHYGWRPGDEGKWVFAVLEVPPNV